MPLSPFKTPWFQGDVPEKYIRRDPGGDLGHCVAITDLFLHANFGIDPTGSVPDSFLGFANTMRHLLSDLETESVTEAHHIAFDKTILERPYQPPQPPLLSQVSLAGTTSASRVVDVCSRGGYGT